MVRTILAVTVIACLFASAASAVVLPFGDPGAGAAAVPGQVLVSFKPGADAHSVHAAVGGVPRRAVAQIGVQVVDLPPGMSVTRGMSEYRRHSGVAWAEPNFYAAAAVVPNDAFFPMQWGPAKVHAPAAWDLTVGGSWPVVAVVDTGVDETHPDLAAKLVPGWNFVANNADTWDDYGHGTHVAGIIAAASNNFDGVAGMAWQNAIMPVKVLDSSGAGTFDAVANGIIYAADRGAAVINLSLGGRYGSQTLSEACGYAYAKGCAVVAAAGNSGSFVMAYPAAYPTVIAVGATDANDIKTSFSNYGKELSVVAPGLSILSTMPMTPVTLNTSSGYDTEYDSLSGTSMASPHVAGLAALLLSANPDLSADGVRDLLQRTALDLGELGWDEVYGYGRIQADAALNEVLYPSPPDTVAPSVTILAPASGVTLSGAAPVSVTAADNIAVSRVEYFVDGSLRKTGGTQWIWQTGAETNGSHTLAARVSDYAGNYSVGSVTVNVSNQTVTDVFSGPLRVAYVLHPFTTRLEGPVKARLTWSKGATLQLVIMYSGGFTAAYTPPTKGGSCSLDVVLPPGQYQAQVGLCSGKTSYTLAITHL